MTDPGPTRLDRLERRALIVAAAGLVVAAVLGCLAPSDFASAYRFAAFACLAPALGSLLFTLILRLTGGQWGPALQPYFNAGIALLPWIWLLTIPLLLLPHASPSPRPSWFEQPAAVLLRAVAYGIAFFLLGAGVRRLQARRRAGDEAAMRWFAPAALIGSVFMLHVLADDWLMALEPGWRSTAFPAVWLTGTALCGYAAALGCAIAGGAAPGQVGVAKRLLGIDWGNLLLAAMAFWCYVTFSQFLIIWAEDLPAENVWYLHRSHGAWLGVIVLIAVFHFAVPFLFLLSRRVKRSARALGALAFLLVAAQWLYLAWVILPAHRPGGFAQAGLAVALLAAAGGAMLNRYLAGARRQREVAA